MRSNDLRNTQQILEEELLHSTETLALNQMSNYCFIFKISVNVSDHEFTPDVNGLITFSHALDRTPILGRLLWKKCQGSYIIELVNSMLNLTMHFDLLQNNYPYTGFACVG